MNRFFPASNSIFHYWSWHRYKFKAQGVIDIVDVTTFGLVAEGDTDTVVISVTMIYKTLKQ